MWLKQKVYSQYIRCSAQICTSFKIEIYNNKRSIACRWNKKPNQVSTKSINTPMKMKPNLFSLSFPSICFICSSFYRFLLTHWCTFRIKIRECFPHMFLRDINSVCFEDMTSVIFLSPICSEVIPLKQQSLGQYQTAITNKNSANAKYYLWKIFRITLFKSKFLWFCFSESR